MNLGFLEGVLAGAVQSGTSVLYAALGEVLVERAGIINLGVEGSMLMGASVGFAIAYQTGNPYLGIVAAALAGGLFTMVFAYLVINRRANQLATGLALMFFGVGLSALIGKPYVGRLIDGLPKINIPFLAELPVIGRAVFQNDLLIYLTVPFALLMSWVLFNTRWGLALRAVGESQIVAFAAGFRPKWVQYQAIFIGGMFAGIGGAHLSLAFARNWTEAMTSGRGFIAVALVIFARWDPLRAVLGALLFGGAEAFQLQLQARGNSSISPFLLNMFPYVLTLVVLLLAGRRRSAMPEGLNAVFEGTN